MPLLALWESNPNAITELTVEQVVATAGDGRLRDDSECSRELRAYLAQVDTERLAGYAERCLDKTFPDSGLVLQDIVNEMGRRLEYRATNGRYRGTPSAIGFDGLWVSPEGYAIVVEVKTTDAYRISLDTIAEYRERLRAAGSVGGSTSALIVVGREDTGELEAQIRGSRHAWDMRLISVDSLLALVRLKESTDAGVTAGKLRSVLVPVEYTRLDSLVDVMFTTARDAAAATVPDVPQDGPHDVGDAEDTEGARGSGWEFTSPTQIAVLRDMIIDALGRRDGTRLVKRSRALYWDASHTVRVVCTISKRYTRRGAPPYWYAYHPTWDVFLSEGHSGLLVLGCVGLDAAFAIPVDVMRQHLAGLNTTTKPGRGHYWHVKLVERAPGEYALHLPATGSALPLNAFRFPLEPGRGR